MDRLARRRVQIADRNTLDTIYEEKEKIYPINRNRMSYTMRTIDDCIDYVLDEVYIYIYYINVCMCVYIYIYDE